MFGTTIRHCIDCRGSWTQGCLVYNECPYCESKNLEEYDDTHWKIDKDGRIVEKEQNERRIRWIR